MGEVRYFSQDEEKTIDEAFAGLSKSYLQSKHRKKIELVTKAFNFARQAHNGIRRHSGEPYILHPLAVAQIVSSEIGLGSTSICAALLHDVVEDTDYTIDDINNVFGPKIAQIVDGLTKIAGGRFGENASSQAENFKKLLLTMSDDIRVIIIKIADRLHNMRTLEHMPVRKQYKISGETLYIYAPLAYRLGLNKIKTELEDLSFRFEHPDEYKEIEEKLAVTKRDRAAAYEEFVAPINAKLQAMGLKYKILRRIKAPYSIWRKMHSKGLSFEEIYDILAVRIIFEPTTPETEMNECFNIYLALTQIYKAHPDRLRDWVTRPKSNGYQALHVTLMGGRGEWVEVQIRSTRMNDIAEQGIAAHWKYKAGAVEGTLEEDDGELNKWLGTIREILEDPQPDSMDFLDTIKLNLFSTEIFVFTSKGEFRTLPQGCTVLDFAFSIHTDIGMHCIGAKVNHKLEPIDYVLKSGDQVEVLTSKSQKVMHEWMDFVTTAPARAKLRSILRKEDRENERFGEAIFNQFLKDQDLESDSAKMERIVALYGLENREKLMIAIGRKEIVPGTAEKNILKSDEGGSWYNKLFGSKKKNPQPDEAGNQDSRSIDLKHPLVITDYDAHSYHFAECCNPVPGDDVIGFVEKDGSVTIHQRRCEVANKLKTGQGNRIATIEWRTEETLFPVDIYIKGIDSMGTLGRVSDVVSGQMNANITKVSIEAHEGIFEGVIRIMVHSLDDVSKIRNGLKKIPGIKTAVRKEE